MKWRNWLWRAFSGKSTDTPIQPHVLMETVPKDMQTGLDCQPVCILGQRWTVPKLVEDQPDYGEPRQPVDFERLPV